MELPRGHARLACLSRIVRTVLAVVLAVSAVLGSAAQQGSGGSVPAPAPIPASRQGDNIAVITIEGMITAVTSKSFARRLERAVDGGADVIVVELDTPGGEVGAVLEITAKIKALQQPTTAWVHPTAYSGGAIIALACDEIVISSGATMGDAAVIAANPLTGIMELPETERSKLTSPLIAEVTDSARRNGYDENLVLGFLQLGVELWLVEDTRTGGRYFLDAREYEALFGEEPPRAAKPVLASASGGAADGPSDRPTPSEMREDYAGATGGDDTAALPGQQSLDPFRDQQLSSTRPQFAQEDADDYRFVRYASDGRALFTLKEAELRAFGFTDPAVTISTDEELKAYHAGKTLRRLDRSFAEGLVAWLNYTPGGWAVRGLLVLVFVVGLFAEITMPGTAAGGIAAVLALAGLFIPGLLIGAQVWWALGAILAGVLLLAAEIFVLPGFGVPAAAGGLLLLAGLIGSFAGTGQLFPGGGHTASGDLTTAVAMVLVGLFGAIVAMWFLSKYSRSLPIANLMVLKDAQESLNRHDEDLIETMGPPRSDGPVSVGEIGVTVSPLRTSGTAEFGDALVDVVSDDGFIDAGVEVRVIASNRYTVHVVRATPEEIEDRPPTEFTTLHQQDNRLHQEIQQPKGPEQRDEAKEADEG